jgi:septum formation protein
MPMSRAEHPLVLASQSTIRHSILRGAGIPHVVHPAEVDERAIEKESASVDPPGIAKLLARAKALAVAPHYRNSFVLGADQTLALGTLRFSKPKDRAGAREQLVMLRGRTHELHSAIAVGRAQAILFECCHSARLTMRAFSNEFLDHYLDTVGPNVMSSVGGYQLEGAGVQLFERIEGDYFAILGLPLLPLLDFLRRNGLVAA